ncbi:hypothetical protein WG68_06600 [Arsukibacterium ikkense]|uniref:Uncharacterized protein n=1 Tax=Arsukibacterium ikkense TaxID=336831 RepID=A0A0M2V6J1_9GAMM|nr:hypothetical protein [Arsukibacterium ikkense]KKO46029.1 hypothetical protein WG68_06600 [Arsukibacterium ikkense]
MVRKVLLLFVVFTLSFQSLSVSLSPVETPRALSFEHAALHFWGQPHTHDADNPEQIQLEFSAEARNHVAHDIHSTAALMQHNLMKDSPVHTMADSRFMQTLPDPFLHRVTPPPRA